MSLTSLTSPSTYGSNQTVPVTWSASDDDFVRNVDIHASYDNGASWCVIAQELDGSKAQFDWKLPELVDPMTAIVRVIVRDKRFQVTSATSATITLVPDAPCYADCDNSGSLNIFDYICFGVEYAAMSTYADCDNSGAWNIFDYICFGSIRGRVQLKHGGKQLDTRTQTMKRQFIPTSIAAVMLAAGTTSADIIEQWMRVFEGSPRGFE